MVPSAISGNLRCENKGGFEQAVEYPDQQRNEADQRDQRADLLA
jgi:hypothetical protein